MLTLQALTQALVLALQLTPNPAPAVTDAERAAWYENDQTDWLLQTQTEPHFDAPCDTDSDCAEKFPELEVY